MLKWSVGGGKGGLEGGILALILLDNFFDKMYVAFI
jgi:hypothetical protein